MKIIKYGVPYNYILIITYMYIFSLKPIHGVPRNAQLGDVACHGLEELAQRAGFEDMDRGGISGEGRGISQLLGLHTHIYIYLYTYYYIYVCVFSFKTNIYIYIWSIATQKQ